MFVDNADLMADSENNSAKMQKILALNDRLFRATNRIIETEKLTHFAWQWY